jgi:thioredoxin
MADNDTDTYFPPMQYIAFFGVAIAAAAIFLLQKKNGGTTADRPRAVVGATRSATTSAVPATSEDPSKDTFTLRVRMPMVSVPEEFKVPPEATVAELARRIRQRINAKGNVSVLSGMPPRPVAEDAVVQEVFKLNEVIVARVEGATDRVAQAAPGAKPPGLQEGGGDGKVTTVRSTAEFDKLLRTRQKVAVDFHADWCGPCKVLAPQLEDLAKRNRAVTFLKVDVDELQELQERFRIEAMPTIVFLSAGREVSRVRGADISGIQAALSRL